MPKEIGTELFNLLSQKEANSPIIILEIKWDSGSIYYSYSKTSFKGVETKDDLLFLSNISTQVKDNNLGSFTTLSAKLRDYTGDLNSKYNTSEIEGVKANIYITYSTTSDNLIIFSGNITSDIFYFESKRELSFSLVSNFHNGQVGLSVNSISVTTKNVETPSYAWDPLTLRVDHDSEYFGNSAWQNRSYTYNNDLSNYGYRGYVQTGDNRFRQYLNTDTGTFRNIKLNVSIEIPNPTGTVTITAENDSGFSTQHQGKMTHVRPLTSMPTYIDVEGSGSGNYECRVFDTWITYEKRRDITIVVTEDVETDVVKPLPYCFGTVIGVDSVRLKKEDGSLVYISNIFPSTQILKVEGIYNTVRKEVPNSYYTIDTNYDLGSLYYSGLSTAIILNKKLSEYDSKWSNTKLYVSLVSSYSENVASSIKSIFTNFSNLQIDNDSFTSVSSQVENFPAHYYKYDVEDIFDYCSNLAKLARCSIFKDGEKIKIKYLSIEPTVDHYITENDVILKSLIKSSLARDDVITRFVYKDSEFRNNEDKYGLVTKNENYDIYHLKELRDFSISYWLNRQSTIWRTLKISCPLKKIGISIFDTVEINIPFFSLNKIKGLIRGIEMDIENKFITLDVLLASENGRHLNGEPIESISFWLGLPNFEVDNDYPKPSPPTIN